MTVHARKAAAVFAIWTLIVGIVLVMAGCHTCRSVAQVEQTYASNLGRESLVLSPVDLLEWPSDVETGTFRAGWEFARNDFHLNTDARPSVSLVAVGDVRTHQRLWTVNGRPHESTLTTFRSWQPRGGFRD